MEVAQARVEGWPLQNGKVLLETLEMSYLGVCLKLGKSPLSKLKSKHCHPTGFLHGNPRHVPREFDASMRAAALQRLNGGTMDLALVRSSGKIGRSNGAATRGSGVKSGMLGVGSWVKVIVFFKPTKYTLVLFFFWPFGQHDIYIYILIF